MPKKLKITLALLLFFTTLAFAQTGTIKGKVMDRDKSEGLPLANVIVELNGNLVTGAQTDFDGNYTIKPVNPGSYTLKVTSVGYNMVEMPKVLVKSGEITFIPDIKMSSGVDLKAVDVVEYKVPLISKDQTQSGGTITRDELEKMPGRSADAVITTVAGVSSRDGEVGSIRGSREGSSDTYIDGQKVRGNFLPKSAIEQITVVTGGLSAQYGDATGGIVSITTRGPSRDFHGGVDLVTSKFLDPYGYNVVGFGATGPLVMRRSRKDSTGKKEPLMGFYISGEYTAMKDATPSAIKTWKMKDDKLADLEKNPVRSGENGDGAILNATYVRQSDMEQVKVKEYAGSGRIDVAGKIDLVTSQTTNLSIGGSFNHSKEQNYNFANSLFNAKNNGEITRNYTRLYGRFVQRFGNALKEDASKKNTVSNAFYSIQVSYLTNKITAEDPNHKDNLFNYGHVGKFTTYTTKTYTYGDNEDVGLKGWTLDGYRDTLYAFDASSSKNPEMAAYTRQYYDLYSGDVSGHYENYAQVEQSGGAILNGSTPSNVYNLWNNTGTPFNNYIKQDQSQLSVNAMGSADIKNHAISVGFEFEQRDDRYFSASPVAFWQRISPFTGLVNNHIRQLDLANPILKYSGPYFTDQDTIEYNRLFDGKSQSYFDYNLRKKLGLNPSGTDWIDVGSYDPSTFSIDYFSADELLGSGNNALVSYYGYDYTGKKLKSRPSFDDFFTKTATVSGFNGPAIYERPIDAFRPIYVAGYIQDKFAFYDLIFNIGLRVDRYDANQKVLKDPYCLYETKKAGEVTTLGGKTITHPGNIENDYVVYVNDLKNPTSVVGYRKEAKWYDNNGVEINDPSVLNTSSGIAPYLVDPNNQVLSSKAFKDYEPQTVFMPRIAFSFPISDEALFFAHYDVLSQRPNGNNRLDPVDYYFIRSIGSTLGNPALKPEKTTDYELGFQQKLNTRSSLKLSAFYREQRDMVQAVRITGAFPVSYTTYGNIDFGTVKGFSVAYDLRRTGNVWVKASYTLQFAGGTGSSASSGLNLVNTGQPNLRTIVPYNSDQRHSIITNVDMHYGTGKDYNGPVWFKKPVLAGAGANFVLDVRSGTPYSAQKNITPQAFLSGPVDGYLQGTLNGSRYPWTYRVNVRIDKNFLVKINSNEQSPRLPVNVYLDIINLLNTKNIIYVYSATGNSSDDGYLAEAQYQKDIEAQNDSQSYREMYAIKVNNPSNYSLPRRMRLGLSVSF